MQYAKEEQFHIQVHVDLLSWDIESFNRVLGQQNFPLNSPDGTELQILGPRGACGCEVISGYRIR